MPVECNVHISTNYISKFGPPWSCHDKNIHRIYPILSYPERKRSVSKTSTQIKFDMTLSLSWGLNQALPLTSIAFRLPSKDSSNSTYSSVFAALTQRDGQHIIIDSWRSFYELHLQRSSELDCQFGQCLVWWNFDIPSVCQYFNIRYIRGILWRYVSFFNLFIKKLVMQTRICRDSDRFLR